MNCTWGEYNFIDVLFWLQREQAPAVGQLWLQMGKVARQCDQLQMASAALIQASQFKTPLCLLQQAKLLYSKGERQKGTFFSFLGSRFVLFSIKYARPQWANMLYSNRREAKGYVPFYEALYHD